MSYDVIASQPIVIDNVSDSLIKPTIDHPTKPSRPLLASYMDLSLT